MSVGIIAVGLIALEDEGAGGQGAHYAKDTNIEVL